MLLAGAFCLRSHPVRNLAPREGPLVAFGDSLTYGIGASDPAAKGYLGLLQQSLGVKFENKGVPGNTTADALARLQKDVLDRKPALVIVELGGNDFLQRVDPDITFANLDKIVTAIQAQGAPVLLLGVQSGLFSDRLEGMYRSLSSRLETGYVSNILRDCAGNPSLRSDPVHPNDQGYVLVAQRVEPELRRLLHAMQRI